MSGSFATNRRFYDDKHFPRGFSRSGIFTIKESELLEAYGHAFKELDEQLREPGDETEQHFVAVCRGEQTAVTLEEKAWLKFKQRTGRRRFHALVGSPRVAAAEADDDAGSSDEDDLTVD
ncbi:DUF413 domain-containing protein [Celerinatantimonas sp. YJH-8]|uniref:DUF413 domain-containing protein n=1 Tax=Celerinatantimonas sp. YJH-8 TaxID=3228714 RepID=UPI0038BF8FD5